MKFDISQTGLRTLLEPYQIHALRFIWKNGETPSSIIHSHNRRTLPDEDKRSRASIINFLNRMVSEEVLNYREESCKGGSRRVYFSIPPYSTEKSYRQVMADAFTSAVESELGV